MKKAALIITLALLLVGLLAGAAAAQAEVFIAPGHDPWLFAPGRFGFDIEGNPIFLYNLRRNLYPYGTSRYGPYPYGAYLDGGWRPGWGQAGPDYGGWQNWPQAPQVPRPGEFRVPPPGFGPPLVDPFAFQGR